MMNFGEKRSIFWLFFANFWITHPCLDYGDIGCHKYDPDLSSVITKPIEQTQYAASLAVTGALRGTSKQQLYDELGWESLY